MKTILTSLLLLSIAHAFAKEAKLPTVANVDVTRYVGKWYAITSLPQFFTRNCLGQTADYGIIDDKTVSVLNTCLEKDNEKSTIEGKAVVVNAETKAELEVTFNSFFTKLFRVKGDYNIIALDPEYKYVMVGSKDRDSLWIMSRSTTMPEDVMNQYIDKAKGLGFPVDNLIRSKF